MALVGNEMEANASRRFESCPICQLYVICEVSIRMDCPECDTKNTHALPGFNIQKDKKDPKSFCQTCLKARLDWLENHSRLFGSVPERLNGAALKADGD